MKKPRWMRLKAAILAAALLFAGATGQSFGYADETDGLTENMGETESEIETESEPAETDWWRIVSDMITENGCTMKFPCLRRNSHHGRTRMAAG